MTASLPLLLERYPGLAPAGQARLRPTFVLRGYETLPVVLSG